MILNQAAQNMFSFWEDPRNIPFKCKLISFNGGTPCMCAQGQTLFKEGGYSVNQLEMMPQEVADKETARILGISVYRSRLLRRINDSYPDAPQDVLTNPEKYLGPNWEAVLKFWHHLDTLSDEDFRLILERYWDLDEDAGISAENNAFKAAIATIRIDYARVVRDATPRFASGYATLELIGSHKLQEHVFLPMFPFTQLQP
jgi:hypothetical protein